MGLTRYKQKRNFNETPEPTGGKPQKSTLRFVIQKHAASHLHYDFRLEMEGVLKSWAVPKGPSLDPAIKRLAMMVEDHPSDYRNFEGIIPSGYGEGTVIVWDEGTYEADGLEGKPKAEQEKVLLHQLHAGTIKFTLHGKKLKGSFALVKTRGRGENHWLLIKHRDDHATTTDILLKEKSVISGKTLGQVASSTTNFYGGRSHKSSSDAKAIRDKAVEKVRVKTAAEKELLKAHRAEARKPKAKTAVKKSSRAKTTAAKEEKKSPGKKAAKKKKAKLPSYFTPMLATLVDEPFDAEGWMYEVKWDGYRALAFVNDEEVELRSRNDKSFNEKFYPVHAALQSLGWNAVLDGEVVVTDERGIANFGALQNWRSEADGELFYYVFDLLWLDGKDLRDLPLSERRALLEQLDFGDGIVRLSTAFKGSGTEFFDIARKMGLEGIIAKKTDSRYLAGERTKTWLKIKSNKRQEVVIGGYTKNEGSAKPFSALLVGVFEGKELVYTGKVGTGFNVKQQREMLAQFKKLETKKCPFTQRPDVNKPSRFRPDPPHAEAFWLKPQFVCEVSFAEITSDGVMRHPSFEGMRSDKKAADVVQETEQPTEKITKEQQQLSEKKIIVANGKSERKTLLNPTDETQVRKINGHELKFTNLSKVFWPKDNITKRDLLNYYYQVAPIMLPYLKDRPQSMNRHPHGITGESFYQKDVTGKAPDWVETYLYHSDADDRDRHYLVCTNEAGLLYMASLGCIEINPWSSRAQKPDHPDWCIIDLDPDTNSFEQVIEAAQVTKQVLDELGVPSYPKTSGSTGIHIYIPLGAKYTYEQSKEFARVIVRLVHRRLPEFTSIERATKNRRGKLYLDFLQNRPQATLAAPYSVRPKPGATVSMPLHWEEVKKGLKMSDFHLRNAMARIKSEGDLFKPVLGKGIDMEKIVKKFKEMD